MKLDYDISTIEGHKEWSDFFMEIPKEQLVELIINQMYNLNSSQKLH